jgi:hypothetical protein
VGTAADAASRELKYGSEVRSGVGESVEQMDVAIAGREKVWARRCQSGLLAISAVPRGRRQLLREPANAIRHLEMLHSLRGTSDYIYLRRTI